MKSIKLKSYLAGIISLLLFGLLLAQSMEAVCVTDYVSWPVSRYLSGHPLGLSILCGMIAGLSEEAGYYLVFKYFLKERKNWNIPLFFGLGRGVTEAVFYLMISSAGLSVKELLYPHICLRLISIGAVIGLSILDYIAVDQTKWILAISVSIHAIMNTFSFAAGREIIHVSQRMENGYSMTVSFSAMIITYLIYRKYG